MLLAERDALDCQGLPLERFGLVVEAQVPARGGETLHVLQCLRMLGSASASSDLEKLPLDRLGIQSVGVSLPMLLFAVGLSLATALVFGVVPAVSAARTNAAEELKSGARTTGGTGVARLRNGFVVFQVALSVVLLIGAGLLMRSFMQLRGVHPGFRSEQLLTARVSLPGADYQDPESRVVFYSGLLDDIRAIPGVSAAGAISVLPIKDGYSNVRAWNPDDPPADPGAYSLAEHRRVLPGYFEAMGIPVLGGRDVEYTDGAAAEPAAEQDVADPLRDRLDLVGQNKKAVRLGWLPHQVAVERSMDGFNGPGHGPPSL